MAKIIFLFLILASQISFSASTAPKWEVRTAPIAVIWGWATLDLSYIANDNWALGPSAVVYAGPKSHMFFPGYNGTAIGGHAIWAESFVTEAFYVSAHFLYDNYSDYPHAYSGRYEVTGSKIYADLGKRWTNSEGISTMFGIGYEVHNHDVTEIPNSGARVSEQRSYGFLHLEAKLGYIF